MGAGIHRHPPLPVTGMPQNGGGGGGGGAIGNLELMLLLISEDNEVSPAEHEGETQLTLGGT